MNIKPNVADSAHREEGAATQVYAATNPLVEGVSGAYFKDCNPMIIDLPNHMFDEALAERLWQETELMLGDYLPTN